MTWITALPARASAHLMFSDSIIFACTRPKIGLRWALWPWSGTKPRMKHQNVKDVLCDMLWLYRRWVFHTLCACWFQLRWGACKPLDTKQTERLHVTRQMFDMGFEPKDKIAHHNTAKHARRPHVDQDCGTSRISTTAERYSVISHSRDIWVDSWRV